MEKTVSCDYCSKELPESSILKHIGNSQACKVHYGPRFDRMKRKKKHQQNKKQEKREKKEQKKLEEKKKKEKGEQDEQVEDAMMMEEIDN